MSLQCNVGGADRKTRIGIGTALLGIGAFAPIKKPLKIAAGIAGIFGVMTGLSRYCPASQALGRNTCRHWEASARRRGTRVVEFVTQA
jgi:hypothetical protein